KGEEVADRYPGCGPLSGVHAGLLQCRTPWLLVVACDLPRITTAALRTLLLRCEEGRSVVARDESGRLQPLCAAYPVSILPVVEAALADNRLAMRDLISAVQPVSCVD